MSSILRCLFPNRASQPNPAFDAGNKENNPTLNTVYVKSLFATHHGGAEPQETYADVPNHLFADQSLTLKSAKKPALDYLKKTIVDSEAVSSSQLVQFHNYLSCLSVLMHNSYANGDQSALSKENIDAHLRTLFPEPPVDGKDAFVGLTLSKEDLSKVRESVVVLCTHRDFWRSSTDEPRTLSQLKGMIRTKCADEKRESIRKRTADLFVMALSADFLVTPRQAKSIIDVCQAKGIRLAPILPFIQSLSWEGKADHKSKQNEKTLGYLSVLAGKALGYSQALELLTNLLSECYVTNGLTNDLRKSVEGSIGHGKAVFFRQIVKQLALRRDVQHEKNKFYTLFLSAVYYFQVKVDFAEPGNAHMVKFLQEVKHDESLDKTWKDMKGPGAGYSQNFFALGLQHPQVAFSLCQGLGLFGDAQKTAFKETDKLDLLPGAVQYLTNGKEVSEDNLKEGIRNLYGTGDLKFTFLALRGDDQPGSPKYLSHAVSYDLIAKYCKQVENSPDIQPKVDV